MVDITKIHERMPVISLDGRAIGFVSGVVGTDLRLTTVKDGRGRDHFIPLDWVAEVQKYVFLNKSRRFVRTHYEEAEPRTSHRRPKAA
jgi:hypothetical protein